jgi:hypothetical protein
LSQTSCEIKFVQIPTMTTQVAMTPANSNNNMNGTQSQIAMQQGGVQFEVPPPVLQQGVIPSSGAPNQAPNQAAQHPPVQTLSAPAQNRQQQQAQQQMVPWNPQATAQANAQANAQAATSPQRPLVGAYIIFVFLSSCMESSCHIFNLCLFPFSPSKRI